MKLRREVDLQTFREVTKEMTRLLISWTGSTRVYQRGGHAGAARPIAGVGGPVCC